MSDRSAGCRGVIGPVPRPLWMNTAQPRVGGHLAHVHFASWECRPDFGQAATDRRLLCHDEFAQLSLCCGIGYLCLAVRPRGRRQPVTRSFRTSGGQTDGRPSSC